MSKTHKRKFTCNSLMLNPVVRQDLKIPYCKLIRRTSIVEKNKKKWIKPKTESSMIKINNPGQPVINQPVKKVKKPSITDEKRMSSFISPIKNYSICIDSFQIPRDRQEKFNTMLNLLEKSQKLQFYMEKLGRPYIKLDESLLWSKKIHKKREYFNSTVFNSCSSFLNPN